MNQSPWWRDAVFYQIYPRSFADSGGDGIGDLPGITAHLDHLAGAPHSLGVDAIWLSPFYPSPMVDFGYDVADYCDVDPVFGTLEDFDALLRSAHARGLRVVIDLIPNHTSDQHPWFQASRTDTTNRFRNWYHWADPAPDGGPPNNWLSEFTDSGSAWTLDPATGQYYLHSFTPQQPDLNWDNPDVRQAMHDVLRFWLERGVDGFRVDVAQKMAKDPHLRDNVPGRPRFDEDLDQAHELLRDFRRVVDAYPDRMLVGEAYVLDPRRMVRYLGETDDELNLVFNFDFLNTPFTPEALMTAVHRAEELTPPHAWPTWALSNHDHSRPATRYNHDGHGTHRARLAAMLLLTLRGTPFLYNGDELGLYDVPIPPEARQDPGCTFLGEDHGRDPERTPMPWDGGPQAGFSSATPWLPIGHDNRLRNVAGQRDDHHSMLNLYRRLLAYRHSSAALRRGSFRALPSPSQTIAYQRHHSGQSVTVVLNCSPGPVAVSLPGPATPVLATTDAPLATAAEEKIDLGPWQGVILEHPLSGSVSSGGRQP